MKKQFLILFIVLALFFAFIYFYITPRNYTVYYIVDNYNITEKYNGKYDFVITKNDKQYTYYVNTKYRPSRKIIKKIYSYNDKEYNCIYLDIKEQKTHPICYKNKQLIDFRLINSQSFNDFLVNKYQSNIEEVNKKIENIIIHNFDKKTYVFWNYRKLIYVNQNDLINIKLFNNDQYNNNLVTMVDNYLFIPNYDQKYFFDQVIIIDLRNGTKNIWKLNQSISYESKILGVVDQEIYIIDEKNQLEYKIDIDKRKILNITTEDALGLIYENNQFKEVKISTIINNNLKFSYKNICNYYVKNNKLFYNDKYRNESLLISNNINPKIAFINDCQVYYFVNDTLYTYYENVGEIKLVENYDWNFNFDNKIFIYQK